ncbi:Short-chain dehydrogenase [Cnuella takakiae]|uniref:Short-chain dehydrogenase n=1 Tax=Cnuella takakiae TaxID=1302690 RepID=A0A1M5DV01_9BACT|nr:SDR family NAD(P)-dependent oxidoreductase [Cnuella takakiae]OLY93857.1 hypothetical protein BUE76_19720 [Cnuella takakiae]SHF70769.1 Short-chain dehydrogenase [Cnuella takakiae]
MSQPKTILITGATGNLGTVVSQYFLAKGYTVIGTARSKDSTADNPSFHLYTVNLADEVEVAGFVARAAADHGRIDAALLLAGGFAMGDIAATSSAAIREQVALNFETAYHVVRPLLSHMQQNGRGRIVFTGSRPALEPKAGHSMLAYALSKALLFQLADMINAANRGSGINAAVIVPGTIDTPANRQGMPDADFSTWVKPESIAAALYFLVSESGSAVSDAVLKLYNGA